MALAGVEQDAFGGGGLAGVDVRDDADVAQLANRGGGGHGESFNRRAVLSRRRVCCVSQRAPGDSPGAQLPFEVPWPEHGRGWSISRRSGIVAISLSYVRMACLALEKRAGRKKRNPGRRCLPGLVVSAERCGPPTEKSKSTQVASVALFTWPTRARKCGVVFMMIVIIERRRWRYGQ
jgi:hypothetical protein